MTDDLLDRPKTEPVGTMTPDDLARCFGTHHSETAGRTVRHLYQLLSSSVTTEDYNNWKVLVSDAIDFPGLYRKKPTAKLTALYDVDDADPAKLLFAVHTYYALIIKVVAFRLVRDSHRAIDAYAHCLALEDEETWRARGITNFLESDVFAWYLDVWDPEISNTIDVILGVFDDFDLSTSKSTTETTGDLFKALYQSLLPGTVRHALGEFYTPDWLASMTLDELEFNGNPNCRLLDPACGSGTYLVTAIQRIQNHTRPRQTPRNRRKLAAQITSNIIGFDINPLAVMAARTNFLFSMGELRDELPVGEIPIYCRDALETAEEKKVPDTFDGVDFVVGNPPWVGWQHLQKDYRDKLKPMWESYGLFSLSGSKGRLGGGKKDLSMLFVYACCDRYLKTNGKLGFLITHSVFKSKGAGDGFRRFQYDSDDSTTYLRPIIVHDFTAFQPFDGATTQTAMLVVQKQNEPFEFPVPYRMWKKSKGRLKSFVRDARPVDPDHDASPWLTAPPQALDGIAKVISDGPYRAYEGVNSGGLNSCYWVRRIQRTLDGFTIIENLASVGHIKVERIRCEVETERVFPLLRSGDIDRWSAESKTSIVLGQDPDTRSGVPEAIMQRDFPKTYDFFKMFEGDPDDVQRGSLRGRSLFRRYFKPSDPFYSMYGVGPYTMSPYKVCWTRIDTRLRGVVVGPSDDGRVVLPQETITFVPVESSTEAHYFCALFNSSPSNALVSCYSTGKGFASAHVLDFIGIPTFAEEDELHQKLSTLSRKCHDAASNDDTDAVEDLENRIDDLAARVWRLSAGELRGVQSF